MTCNTQSAEHRLLLDNADHATPPTRRTIKGRTYTHIQHKTISTGNFKKIKLAQLDNQEIVARGVIVSSLNMFQYRQRHILHGIEVSLQYLAGINGICRPLDYCIVDRKHYQANEAPQKIEIYYPYYQNGDLFDLLKQKSQQYPRENEYKWTLQILETLSEIHQRGVYHRDIKEENILVDSNWNIGLCDFDGCWVKGDPDPTKKFFSLTAEHLAPEYTTGHYSLQDMDIWATGMVLYHLHKKCYLHKMMYPTRQQLQGIPFLRQEPRDPIDHVIWEMLRIDPSKRISAKDAFEKMKQAIHSSPRKDKKCCQIL